MNSTTRILNYTYTSAGTYNGTITVFNTITWKTQPFTINVLEKVVINSFNGSAVSPPNVSFNMIVTLLSGTLFNCTLSGEGLTNVTQPWSGLSFPVKWPTDGFYKIRMDCYNEMSRDFRLLTQPIFSTITGTLSTLLRLLIIKYR